MLSIQSRNNIIYSITWSHHSKCLHNLQSTAWPIRWRNLDGCSHVSRLPFMGITQAPTAVHLYLFMYLYLNWDQYLYLNLSWIYKRRFIQTTQAPTAVHLYLVPAHFKPGLLDALLADLARWVVFNTCAQYLPQPGPRTQTQSHPIHLQHHCAVCL